MRVNEAKVGGSWQELAGVRKRAFAFLRDSGENNRMKRQLLPSLICLLRSLLPEKSFIVTGHFRHHKNHRRKLLEFGFKLTIK